MQRLVPYLERRKNLFCKISNLTHKDTAGLFLTIPVGWPIEGMLMALTYLNTLMACKSLLVH